MLTFECRKIGMDCDYVATAESISEVLEMAKTHAQEFHGDVLMNLLLEDNGELNKKMVLSISDNIVDVAPGDDDMEIDEEEAEETAEYS